MFVSRYNKAWKSWRTAFYNADERAKLANFRFHDLRRCFGSWLAKNGTDIKAIILSYSEYWGSVLEFVSVSLSAPQI